MALTLSEMTALFQATTSLIGIIAILWGLAQMQQAGRRRDREIDVMAETLRQSAFQQAETLGKIGIALDRQGEVLGKIGEGLDRQGEVLAELLRGR